MKPWAIYYRNGTIFRSRDGEPHEAPRCGVLAIVIENDKVGQLIHCERDYYSYEEEHGGWQGLDEPGFWQYMFMPGRKNILFGQMDDNEVYKNLIKRIKNDPSFANKSARETWEPEF